MNPATSVLHALRKRDLLPADALLIIGVSGGTDSLALLHILRALGVRLHVATLDHGLRGVASAADARFVVETAEAWGLPVTAGQADVRALAKAERLSIEAAARAARYDFLSSVAHEVDAQRVAVAHNADDQVETVLLHLLRGAGMGGLAGMAYAAPLPGHPDLTLIRPLLDVPRAALDAYCRDHSLQPRRDASNADARYRRNRLRLDLIPKLREVSPQIERRLFQLGEIVRVEDAYIDSAMHTAVDACVTRDADRIHLPREVFRTLDPALRRRFVLWAVASLGATADVGYVHVAAAVRLGVEGAVGARAQLKGGVQLRVDYDAVVIEQLGTPTGDDLPLLPEGVAIPIAVPGVTPIIDGWSLHAALSPFDSVSLRLAVGEGSTVVLRGRRTGDRFTPLGLNGHTQKIGKWMTDHLVPRDVRDRLPLLLVDSEIAALWWRGWTVSEAFAVSERSDRIVYFEFRRNSEAAREKT